MLHPRPYRSTPRYSLHSKRIDPPSHRHAAPSAPWPWIDIGDDVDPVELESNSPTVPTPCNHDPCQACWRDYPKSLYPNWTPRQVKKSNIALAKKTHRKCTIYQLDVDNQGLFKVPPQGAIVSQPNNPDDTWNVLVKMTIPNDVRVRILFVEEMSGPVLQMLGAKYNIEPFFFSSSLNWIPSRYQEGEFSGQGDHVTICLPFLRSTPAKTPLWNPSNNQQDLELINTQAPLNIEGRVLLPDLLSLHLIRGTAHGSTIISYHADKSFDTTSAEYLHKRVRFAGKSVYWQNIFRKSTDPTLLLLTFIWHTVYAWDEALEHLYAHVCALEGRAILEQEMRLTQDLHVLRAHLYHYSSLLNDLRKSVEFVRGTKNPSSQYSEESGIMHRESSRLITEIDRLERGMATQDQRLKNAMNLVFSSVNINDSKLTARDSAGESGVSLEIVPHIHLLFLAMKQIAYLTMIFLPSSFVAAVFGMNVTEIVPDTLGTLAHYFAAAIPLTFATIWIIIAFHSRHTFPQYSFWKRLYWPYFLILRLFGKERSNPDFYSMV
ncbi:hypothetical protein D9613_011170 [Agrocybe pediades]|uniref:Uncharacterized protein n=1 Tax=Agrocybe pediades TaxID=84607 RepID=A0A8H4VM37_9AGAR|nr:hypothetical protein D9613_011170 [Agrocybe pediades]